MKRCLILLIVILMLTGCSASTATGPVVGLLCTQEQLYIENGFKAVCDEFGVEYNIFHIPVEDGARAVRDYLPSIRGEIGDGLALSFLDIDFLTDELGKREYKWVHTTSPDTEQYLKIQPDLKVYTPSDEEYYEYVVQWLSQNFSSDASVGMIGVMEKYTQDAYRKIRDELFINSPEHTMPEGLAKDELLRGIKDCDVIYCESTEYLNWLNEETAGKTIILGRRGTVYNDELIKLFEEGKCSALIMGYDGYQLGKELARAVIDFTNGTPEDIYRVEPVVIS